MWQTFWRNIYQKRKCRIYLARWTLKCPSAKISAWFSRWGCCADRGLWSVRRLWATIKFTSVLALNEFAQEDVQNEQMSSIIPWATIVYSFSVRMALQFILLCFLLTSLECSCGPNWFKIQRRPSGMPDLRDNELVYLRIHHVCVVRSPDQNIVLCAIIQTW